MHDTELNLARYLETERLLNAFFTAFDYCLPRCVALERRRNGGRAVAACCTRGYYCCNDLDHPAFARLRAEREARYGKPQAHRWENPVSPCPYHNPEQGCSLATHKSPTCLSYLCPSGIDCLRGEFGIYEYDYLGVYHALEWILTGALPSRQRIEFNQSIVAMTVRVQRPIHPPSSTGRMSAVAKNSAEC